MNTMAPLEKIEILTTVCNKICIKSDPKLCDSCPVSEMRMMYVTDIDKNMILKGIERNIITIKGSRGTVFPEVNIKTCWGVKDMALGPFKDFSLEAVIERIHHMAKYNKIYSPNTYCLWYDALLIH